MSRDPRVYLEDVLESIRRINTYVTGIDQEGLSADELRLDAVSARRRLAKALLRAGHYNLRDR